jgi:proteic killer suppression protein
MGRLSPYDVRLRCAGNIPGFRLHPLKGADRGRWSSWVNGNWRLTFEFRDGQAYVLDYEDYH